VTLPTQTLARLLLAPLLVLAAGMLVKGYTDVGDGFAAGLLAAVGFVLQDVAFGQRRAESLLPVRWAYRLALGGLGLALAVAVAPMLAGEPVLKHRPEPGVSPVKVGTLELITPVLFDVGVCLLVLGTVVTGLHLFAHPGEEEEQRS
jgi:multisubunit Na+/H+ antiporter MnhB subunit